MATYRQPDEARLAAQEQERLAREQAEQQALAEDRAAIVAMKDLLHGLGPGGSARVILAVLAAGACIPVVCARLGMIGSRTQSDMAACAALLSGSALGVASIVLSVRVLLSRTGRGRLGVLGVLVGLALLPWSAFWAMVVVLSAFRMD